MTARFCMNMGIFVALVTFPASAQVADCLQECSKETTPECLKLTNVFKEADIPTGMARLYDFMLALPTDSRLTKSRLQQMFGVNEDACGRSDTNFGDNILSNTGPNSCRISTQISLTSPQSLTAAIILPSNLNGSYKMLEDVFDISFDLERAHKNAPKVFVGNMLLNNDWGGFVKRVQFQKSKSVITTENGCILYRFQ